MSEVYVVFREAVYRHACGGVFETLEAAKAAADFLAEEDADDHHTYQVVPFRLNAIPSLVKSEGGWGCQSPAIGEADPVYAVCKTGVVEYNLITRE